MYYRKFLILGFLLLIGYFVRSQTPFDSTLVYNQQEKLGRFYFDLMQHAGSVKVINEEGHHSVIASPKKNLRGEAKFVYEVGDNDSLINVYMTEFWCYSLSGEVITAKDYIVFVDEHNLGFDFEKVQKHKLNPISSEPIHYLFEYVKKNRKFEVIKPREKNLKYQRVRFE